MSLGKPPMNCTIAKLFGRRATPISSTATMAKTVFVHPSEKEECKEQRRLNENTMPSKLGFGL